MVSYPIRAIHVYLVAPCPFLYLVHDLYLLAQPPRRMLLHGLYLLFLYYLFHGLCLFPVLFLVRVLSHALFLFLFHVLCHDLDRNPCLCPYPYPGHRALCLYVLCLVNRERGEVVQPYPIHCFVHDRTGDLFHRECHQSSHGTEWKKEEYKNRR